MPEVGEVEPWPWPPPPELKMDEAPPCSCHMVGDEELGVRWGRSEQGLWVCVRDRRIARRKILSENSSGVIYLYRRSYYSSSNLPRFSK